MQSLILILEVDASLIHLLMLFDEFIKGRLVGINNGSQSLIFLSQYLNILS